MVMATRSGTPALTRFLTAVRRKVVPQHSRGAGVPAGRRPRLPEVASALAEAVPAAQIREEIWDDPAGLPLHGLDPLDLSRELRPQLRRQLHDAAVVVLRRTYLET